MKRVRYAFSLVMLIILSPSGCIRNKVMYEPAPITVASRKIDVKKAVHQALADYGWFIERESPGLIIAREVRDHYEARVRIRYDDKSIRLDYLDSKDLNFHEEGGQRHIHTRYNTWVHNLERRIAVKVQQ